MYTYLTGTFDIPTPINYLGSMSVGKYIMMVVDRTNPWVLSSSQEPQVTLSKVEVYYKYISNGVVDSIPNPPPVLEESNEAYLPA